MENKVCGEFPEFCYKTYDNEDHATQFVSRGKFRLNCLGYCRNMENISRQDPTEGFGHTLEPDIVTVGLVSPNPKEKTIWTREEGHKEHHIECGNKIYCYCTCLPEVNFAHMLKVFGKYIVKINDPRRLAGDINEYLAHLGERYLMQGCRIIYDKGQKLKEKLTNNERLDRAYKQKLESFSPNCEFRIVAMKFGNPCHDECKFLSGQFEQIEPKCKFIEIDLGKKLDYLELVIF
jgi:hypothetical protein